MYCSMFHVFSPSMTQCGNPNNVVYFSYQLFITNIKKIYRKISSTVHCLTAKNVHLAKNHTTDKSKLLTWKRKIQSVCWSVKQYQVDIPKIADVLVSKHSANHAQECSPQDYFGLSLLLKNRCIQMAKEKLLRTFSQLSQIFVCRKQIQ